MRKTPKEIWTNRKGNYCQWALPGWVKYIRADIYEAEIDKKDREIKSSRASTREGGKNGRK